MTAQIVCPDARNILAAARHRLRRDAQPWSGGRLMSAYVPGAADESGWVAAGWPSWLAACYDALYDEDAGVRDEYGTANEWALEIAELLEGPIDCVAARQDFLAACVEPTVPYDRGAAGARRLCTALRIRPVSDEVRNELFTINLTARESVRKDPRHGRDYVGRSAAYLVMYAAAAAAGLTTIDSHDSDIPVTGHEPVAVPTIPATLGWAIRIAGRIAVEAEERQPDGTEVTGLLRTRTVAAKARYRSTGQLRRALLYTLVDNGTD